MSLIQLIDQYRTDLAVTNNVGISEIVNRYRGFAQELVKLPSFAYSCQEMRKAVAHMMGLGFNRDTMCYVAAYCMRRVVLEAVADISTRGEIWNLLELASLLEIGGNNGKETLRTATQEYINRVGKPMAEQTIERIKEEFKKVAEEVGVNYDSYQKARVNTSLAERDKLIIKKTAETHSSHILALEKILLNDILEVVSSL